MSIVLLELLQSDPEIFRLDYNSVFFFYMRLISELYIYGVLYVYEP